MDPLTRTRPKVLLSVAGRPMLDHLLLQARTAGIRRATVVVHAGADEVRASCGDGSAYGLDVDYVEQGRPGGTGHAVAALAGHVTGDFVLVSGDSFLAADDLRALLQVTGNAVGGRRVPDVRAYGLLDVRDGHVHGIREKPAEPQSGLANAGSYRFTPDVIKVAQSLSPSPRGELELTDAVSQLAREGQPAAYIEVPSWIEAGRPWDLLSMQAAILSRAAGRIDGAVGARVDMEGVVVIEAGATVMNGTRLEGPCYIGSGARVGPNAYLRPGSAIGRGCHVGASVEIKNSIVGEGSNVPHLSYIGDSVIGQRCNLGAGTQVANLKVNDRNVRIHWKAKEWVDTGRRKLGVIMGDDVKVGVNCSINPGTVLCPGTRVGAGQVLGGWHETPA